MPLCTAHIWCSMMTSRAWSNTFGSCGCRWTAIFIALNRTRTRMLITTWRMMRRMGGILRRLLDSGFLCWWKAARISTVSTSPEREKRERWSFHIRFVCTLVWWLKLFRPRKKPFTIFKLLFSWSMVSEFFLDLAKHFWVDVKVNRSRIRIENSWSRERSKSAELVLLLGKFWANMARKIDSKSSFEFQSLKIHVLWL